MSWQQFFDSKFPEGALVGVELGDPDTDPVMLTPRIHVLVDEPAPKVWMHLEGAPQPMVPMRIKFADRVKTSKGNVYRLTTESHVYVLSSLLTDTDRRVLRRVRDEGPPEKATA